MKTLSIGFMFLFLCCACSHSKGGSCPVMEQPEAAKPGSADSLLMDSAEIRSLTRHIDQTFDDFVYAYASDKRIQLLRTRFPLVYATDSVQVSIPREEWVHNHLYTDEVFYNILFDNEPDMDLEKDPTVNNVYVAQLDLERSSIRCYNFERREEQWMLESIREHSLEENPNQDFLVFFHRFCCDSVFQRQHIQSPLKFVTSDPEDDFKVIEAFIDVDQWFVFRPVLPGRYMTNINYGQHYNSQSPTKIVAFRTIGSGFSNTLFFTRNGQSWELSAFEDLSN